MNRHARTLAAALAAATLAACQRDAGDPVSPVRSPRAGVVGDLVPLRFPSAVDRIVPGEVLVGVKSGADFQTVARGHGLSIARLGYENRFAVLSVARGNELAMAARLAADPRVEYAEPNYLRQPDGIDPKLWAFYNPGGLTISFENDPNGRTGTVTSKISKLDADEDNIAAYAAGGADVVIGSIDTGVDLGHEQFLQGQLISGTDWIDGGDPTDTEGHGTHTTGTMVGQTVGVAGVSGAGPHVRVLVQRVCDASGCPTSAIVNAINAAAKYTDANGKHLVAVNLSLGGSFESTAERNAIQNATNQGVLVIASAGNDGTSRISCPACDANAVSVAALNWQDQLAYYSNYGRGLDISAPGGEMYSNTSEEGGIYSSVPGGYAYYQGTSMAAPQVTGTAAIVASVKGLRGSALRSQLLGTADKLGKSNSFGAGRVNSYRAVTGTTLGGGQ